MFNRKTNTLMFPHIILGNVILGKEYTFNSINGGFTRLADLNIQQNRFFGGGIWKLGMIQELGMYACPHMADRKICGLYIHDPKTLTQYGKAMLEQLYPNATIVYDKSLPTAHTQPALAQIRDIKRENKKEQDTGGIVQLVDDKEVDEIENVLSKMTKISESVHVDEFVNTVSEKPIVRQRKA